MDMGNEYLNAVPEVNPTAIFLDRHTPTGLFQGQNTERFWVVDTSAGKRAITLSDLYMPMFAVFTLTDRRLDFGWPLGKPTLHLDVSVPSVDPTDAGIIGIDDFGVAMQCLNVDGNTEWVVLGVYQPTYPTGVFFEGWKVFEPQSPGYPFAERDSEVYYQAEPFEPHWTVECAEQLELQVNCRS
jgi:hypothetical protein